MSTNIRVDSLNIPGLDTQTALRYMNGNGNLYLSVLGSFVKDFSDAGTRIQEGVEQGDLVAAERLVHTIKGLVGTLGAVDVQAAAADLNGVPKAVLAGERDPDGIETDLTVFVSVLDSFLDALRQAGIEGTGQHPPGGQYHRRRYSDGRRLPAVRCDGR